MTSGFEKEIAMAEDSDFYRPSGAAPKDASYSTEELEKRLALAKAIATNLRIIRDDGTGLEELSDVIIQNLRVIGADATDLSALEHRLSNIAQALTLVREFSVSLDLEKLELRAASIASALKLIADNEVVKELGKAS
jgi:hypothetical protein